MESVTLRTERLELSAPRPDDVDEIFAACQDASIQRYTTVPVPYRRSDAESFVALTARWWADGTEVHWAIRRGGRLAGMIGIHHIVDEIGEIGYWVTPDFRGAGVLTEAGRAVVDRAFSAAGLDLKRLEWRAVVGNTASAWSARALGFRYEGVLRGAMASGRGHEDAWVAGLLPADDRTPQPWSVLD
ncbi:GNAT family N-acetyltransferase [Microbacterium sp. MC2]